MTTKIKRPKTCVCGLGFGHSRPCATTLPAVGSLPPTPMPTEEQLAAALSPATHGSYVTPEEARQFAASPAGAQVSPQHLAMASAAIDKTYKFTSGGRDAWNEGRWHLTNVDDGFDYLPSATTDVSKDFGIALVLNTSEGAVAVVEMRDDHSNEAEQHVVSVGVWTLEEIMRSVRFACKAYSVEPPSVGAVARMLSLQSTAHHCPTCGEGCDCDTAFSLSGDVEVQSCKHCRRSTKAP